MSTDILYYLRANGAQFSEEMRKTFGDAERQAADAAKQMKASFDSGFNQVQDLAKKALAMPRLDGGALNLGSSAADARQAAAAFTEQANALNQIVLAAERVAIKEGDASEATRLWIQGARAAKIEAEQQAASLNAQATSLERLQAELGITSRQQTVVTSSSGRQRAAMQQLSFQINDVATSLAGGINPMVVFAQQGSQIVQAIGMMKEEATGFIGFLSGPWGAAIMGAVTIVGLLGSKMLLGADAAETHKKADKSLEEAIHDLNVETGKAIQTSQQAAQATLHDAEAKRQNEIRTRNLTKAQLEAEIANAQVARSVGMTIVALQSEAKIPDLQAQLAKQNKAISEASAAIIQAKIPILMQQAAEATDGAAAAAGRYDRALAGLQEQYAKDGNANAFRKGVIAITQARNAETEAANKSKHATDDDAKAKREATKAYDDYSTALQNAYQKAVDFNGILDRLDPGARLDGHGGVLAGRPLDLDLKSGTAAIDERDRKQKQLNDEWKRQHEQQISELADFYESAFSGSQGSIWKQFKDLGKRAIAEIAAYYTLSLLSGQKPGSFDSVLSALSSSGGVFSGQGGGLLSLTSLFGSKGSSAGVGTGTFGSGPQAGGVLGLNNSLSGVFKDITGSAAGAPQISGALTGASALGAGLQGAAIGSVVGGLTSVLGLPSSSAGSTIGGTVGAIAGSIIPGVGTVVGSMIGSTIGSVFGGIFKKKPKGRAVLNVGSDGDLGYALSGNKASAREASGSAADSVIQGLQSIADQLGATIGGPISTTIGTYKGNYRVNTTGSDVIGGSRSPVPGLTDFGKDGGQKAVEFAIRDAIGDGVLKGISDASKRIIASGKDLDKAIQQAVLIESIPKQLKAIKDPFGAAADDLKDQFKKIVDALDAGSASAEQRA